MMDKMEQDRAMTEYYRGNSTIKTVSELKRLGYRVDVVHGFNAWPRDLWGHTKVDYIKTYSNNLVTVGITW